MKRWIFPKLLFDNSILKICFWYAIVIIPAMHIILSFYLYNVLLNHYRIEYSARKQEAIKILSSVFEKNAQFGDFVNTRNLIMQIGKPLGLIDLGVCLNGKEVLPRIIETRCQKVSGVNRKTISLASSGRKLNLELEFFWENPLISYSAIFTNAVGISFIISVAIILVLFFIFAKIIAKKVKQAAQQISQISCSSSFPLQEDSLIEMAPVAKVMRDVVFQLQKSIEEKNVLVQKQKIADMAQQVAHDIRSPLAALDMLMQEQQHFPANQRLLMRSAVGRIQDIASDLLAKNKVADKDYSRTGETKTQQRVLITTVLIAMISEKRLQYRSKANLEIRSCWGENITKRTVYGLFAQINVSEFQRVISNLLNNAVEALDLDTNGQRPGVVTMDLQANGDANTHRWFEIIISDNGKGIAPEILANLGQRGESYGKQGGQGLGLFHARKAVESWGGKLAISSLVGQGTTVRIVLPQVMPPASFTQKIFLSKQSTIVVVDDDDSIHQIWRQRLASWQLPIISFTAPEKFAAWISQCGSRSGNNDGFNNYSFFMDYEFMPSTINGLELIKKWQLAGQSYLVTSRSEDAQIIAACEQAGIKMLPKMMAGFVPIIVKDVKSKGTQAVLLDDDLLIRMLWENRAQEKNVSLKVFASSEELWAQIENFDRTTVFYLDAQLAHGEKGEEVARSLFGRGFPELYLATGYDQEQFHHLPFLRGVMGKMAPW